MCKPIGGMTQEEHARGKRVVERSVLRKVEAAVCELAKLAVLVGLSPNPKRELHILNEALDLLKDARDTSNALVWHGYTVDDFLDQEEEAAGLSTEETCCVHGAQAERVSP